MRQCLLKRPDPGQTRRQIASVKEGFQALVTQDRIDVCRVPPIRTRVADEDIKRSHTTLMPAPLYALSLGRLKKYAPDH